MSVLEVRVGERVERSLARFGETLNAAKAGQKVKPYFGIGFRTMVQFGEVFTPKRWELVEFPRASGPPHSPSASIATTATYTTT